MILSKQDYLSYIESDRIALGRKKRRFSNSLFYLVAPDYIWDFQLLLRKIEYYKNKKDAKFYSRLAYLFFRLKYKKFSLKLGFSIPENVFGSGLAIVHYGTIVVNQNAKVGSNCRIHPCTIIGASGGSGKAPQIGDNVYIAPGAKIFGDIKIASNCAIGANSVVNKSFDEEGVMIAGIPAKVIKPIKINKIIKHI